MAKCHLSFRVQRPELVCPLSLCAKQGGGQTNKAGERGHDSERCVAECPCRGY